MSTSNFPVRPVPDMFCFGGNNVAIEVSKIKSVENLYYEDYASQRYIPILYIELSDGTRITIDFDTTEEVEEAIRQYKKHCIFNRVK